MDFDIMNPPQAEVLPPRIVIYGEPKVGKSRWASGAHKPFFIDTEKGHNELHAVMGDAYRGYQINSFDDFNEILNQLRLKEHDYRTLVIDTVDWLESFIQAHICKVYEADSIQDAKNKATNYGGGYVKAAELMRDVTRKLDALNRKKKMAIVLVCHANIRKIETPEETYERFEMKLEKRCVEVVREWADCLLFMRQEMRESSSGKKINAEKVILTGGTATALVGCRRELPERIEPSWNAFLTAYEGAVK